LQALRNEARVQLAAEPQAIAERDYQLKEEQATWRGPASAIARICFGSFSCVALMPRYAGFVRRHSAFM